MTARRGATPVSASRRTLRAKRVFDLAVSMTLLLLLSPVLGLIAVAVRLAMDRNRFSCASRDSVTGQGVSPKGQVTMPRLEGAGRNGRSSTRAS